MVTVFIILVIVALIAYTVLYFSYPEKRIFSIKKAYGAGLSGLAILMLFNGAFFFGDSGYSYLVTYFNGSQKVEMTPGIHFKGWGESEGFKKNLTVKASDGVNEQNGAKNVSGRIPSIPIRFNDSVKADVSLSVRFKLPEDKENFKRLAIEFRTQENLVNSTLISSVSEATRNSAKLVSAQAYIAGRGGDFDTSVLDQLKNGVYLLNSKAEKVKTKIETAKEGETEKIEEKIIYTVNVKRDKNGTPLVKDTVLKDLNILVTQAIIDNIEPEPKFKELLAKQMSASAGASIKKQEAKTAEWDRQKIIAKGETEKAQIQVEQEKIKIQKTIEAETLRDKAKIEKDTAAILLDKAKIDAQSTKTLADAESYKKREIFKADGALEKKLATLEKINQYYAEAMKGQPLVPTTVIGGNGNSSSAMDLVNLMTAKTARDLNLNLTPNK